MSEADGEGEASEEAEVPFETCVPNFEARTPSGLAEAQDRKVTYDSCACVNSATFDHVCFCLM